MMRFLLLILLLSSLLSAGEVELEFDLSSPDPLTAAITRGAEKAYEVNSAGLDALERGDIKSAEAHFREAMSLIPLYSDAQNNLGVVFFRTERIDSALALWRSITVSDEEYHLSWYNLGLHAFEQKKYERAIGYLKKAEKYNPRFGAGKFLRAQCYYELGEKRLCAPLLKEAHSIDSTNEEVLEYYALFTLEQGDTTKALTLLANEESLRAVSLRGEILALQGRYDEALPLLLSVKEQDSSGGVQEVLVDIYLDKGEMDKAFKLIKDTKRFIDTLPVSMWINAAFTLSEQGRPKDAIRWLNKAYLHYNDPDILYNLGQLHYRVGNFDQSIECINRLPENYHDGQSYFVLANAYVQIEQEEKAKEAVYSALYYETKSDYYLLLGRVLKTSGETESAKIQFQKALSINEGFEDAKIELALLNEGGDYKQLITILEGRLGTCRRCYDEKNRLALLYQLSGTWEKGVSLIERDAHRDRDLAMTLFYILEKAGQYQRAKKVLQKAVRKKILLSEDQLVFARFLSEYRYFKESNALALKIASQETVLAGKCYYLLGYNNMKSRKYKNARTYLEKSHKLIPEDVSVKSSLAYVLQKLGDNKNAEKLWKKSIEYEESATNLVNLGLLSYQKKEYQKALQYYRNALSLDENHKLYINMGNCYYGLEQYGHAYEMYDKALVSKDSLEALAGMYWTAKKKGDDTALLNVRARIEAAPLSNAGRRVLADYYFYLKTPEKAKLYLQAVDSLDGGDYLLLSKVYLALNEFVKAELYADSAMHHGITEHSMRDHLQALAYAVGDLKSAQSYTTGSDARDLYNRAVLLYESKSYAEYLFFVKEKLFFFSGKEKLSLLQMAGDCAAYLKKWDELLHWSQKQYQLEESAHAAYNCAVAAYNLEDVTTAYHYYKKAQAVDSSIKNSDIENRYLQMGREESTQQAVESDLSRADSLYNSAIVFHRKGEVAKAENIYRVILELDNSYHRAWNNLGIIYGERGDIDDAVACYKSSIARRSDIADGYINLVYLYIAIEEYGQAKKWLKRGLKQHTDNKQLRQFERDLAK